MRDGIETVINQNVGLLYKQLHKFHLASDADAISFGYEALWKAVTTYSADKDVKFSTYATVCIFNALGSYVRTLNRQRQLEVISYNNIVDNTTEYLELLKSPVNIEDEYVRNEYASVLDVTLESVFNMLSKKHKEIITRWIDSDFEATATQIAKEVGCSQSYVSQVEAIFKGKFKKRLEESNC